MYTSIELDKTRNLKYSLKSIAMMERKLGKDIGSVDSQHMTIDEKTIYLWAGLYHEDITLTPEKLLDIIDEKNISMTYVMEKIADAVNEAFPEDVENPTPATAE